MKKQSTQSTLKRLVQDKLAESLITMAEAAQIGLRALEASQVARLPNIPPGPHNPGLLIQYFDIDGTPLLVPDCETKKKVLMYRFRYLPALCGNGFSKLVTTKPHGQKYTQPLRVGCSLYLPSLVDWREIATNAETEVWVTEGELKSITATKLGQPTIGLGGVWNFKGQERPLSDLFYQFIWKDRNVVCVYDSDYVTNHNVRYASDRLARALTDLGAHVYLLIVPVLP